MRRRHQAREEATALIKEDIVECVAAEHGPGRVVLSQYGATSYLFDDSRRPFKGYGSTAGLSAAQVNTRLNLNLGLGLDPMAPTVRKTLRFVNDALLWLERLFFAAWVLIPLMIRHKFCMSAWAIYHALHSRLIGRRSGIHPDASLEYHSMTSLMYWARFLPMPVERMRFHLNQLQVYYPTSSEIRKEAINTEKVSGVYIHCGNENNLGETHTGSKAKPRVIFWLYGGAFIAGDAEGNIGMAEIFSKACNCDVMVINYRLFPEHDFDDPMEDVCNAYDYLTKERGVPGSRIQLFGISSGGGLALSLLQKLVAAKDAKETSNSRARSDPERENDRHDVIPAGAVLMGPYVDYTEPGASGSMKVYAAHDLFITESVFETTDPFVASKFLSDEKRKEVSPVYGNMDGLPPLCVVASVHECCYDQSILLVNRAREAGVPCTLGLWKYMCHVWPWLAAFIPEGKDANDFMCEWIKLHFT